MAGGTTAERHAVHNPTQEEEEDEHQHCTHTQHTGYADSRTSGSYESIARDEDESGTTE